MPRKPEAELPLPHLSFQILLALADGPRHGWSIIKRIDEFQAGALPSSGSLYLAMLRLQKQGLIDETGAPAEVDRADERRRYYDLTAFGAKVLRAETLRLARLVRLAWDRDVISELPI